MADLVERLEHAPDSIATAANGEFITRNRRGAYVLCLGDQIDLFQPIVGG
jgi:thiamine biosynthesis protein ThiS